MKPGDLPPITLRDGIGGVVAILVVGALCWSALHDQSQSSQTALVGAAGAVTGWLFRGGANPPSNGNGNGAPPASGVGP